MRRVENGPRVGGRRQIAIRMIVAAAVICAWIGAAAQSSPDIATEFKYGSIGTEGTVGVPYWLWKVLPEVFADKLPNRAGNGWERIGFTYDNPRGDLPMGASRSNDWVPRVGLNCATCHSGAYREAPGAAPKIVLGMPAHQMDLQAYARFLSACANDPRFTAETLIAAMQKHPEFGFFDGLTYRLFAISATRKGILERDPRHRLVRQAAAAGPGPRRYLQSLQGDVLGRDEFQRRYDRRHRRSAVALEPADAPRVWLHWDGNNDLGRGAEQERRDRRRRDAGIARPGGDDADRGLDSRSEAAGVSGRPHQRGAGEHGPAALSAATARAATTSAAEGRTGRSTSREIGPIRERLDSFTPELAQGMNTIGTASRGGSRTSARPTATPNMPLDGIWLRAPYLHNGSVPTLRALLCSTLARRRSIAATTSTTGRTWASSRPGPTPRRAASFSRRPIAAMATAGTLWHSSLSVADRQALLEYLKTQ